jgi:transposase
LERGRFVWPTPVDGARAITAAQLGYMLEGIDGRHPQWSSPKSPPDLT